MSRTPKVDRARRNALKAAGLVGAFLATASLHTPAAGQSRGNGNGNNGNGNGNNGNGNGNGGNNQGGSCFERAR